MSALRVLIVDEEPYHLLTLAANQELAKAIAVARGSTVVRR